MENGTTDIKVQLEGLKKDIENVTQLNGRLDLAIEKLTDVSSSIKSMLAVHEEKITRQEQIDEIIFEKIKDRGDEIDRVYRELQRDIALVEKRLLNEIKSLRNDVGPRIGLLEQWKWVIIGGSIVVGFILSTNFARIIEMMS